MAALPVPGILRSTKVGTEAALHLSGSSADAVEGQHPGNRRASESKRALQSRTHRKRWAALSGLFSPASTNSRNLFVNDMLHGFLFGGYPGDRTKHNQKGGTQSAAPFVVCLARSGACWTHIWAYCKISVLPARSPLAVGHATAVITGCAAAGNIKVAQNCRRVPFGRRVRTAR